MQTGNFYPLLSPFSYTWRLWGRRKVHSPLPLYLCIKIPYYLSSPPISFQSFSGKKMSLFLSMTLRAYTAQGKLPPWDLALLLVSLVLFSSFLGALFLGGVWVIEQPWAFGDLNCFCFFLIYKNTKHSIPENQKLHLPLNTSKGHDFCSPIFSGFLSLLLMLLKTNEVFI